MTVFRASDDCPGTHIGALRLTSTGTGDPPNPPQPLAAVAEEYTGSRHGAYNAFSAGDYALYAPILERNFSGDWNSAIYLHDVSGYGTTVYVDYLQSDGTVLCTDQVTLPKNGQAFLYQGSTSEAHTCLHDSNKHLFAAHMYSAGLFVAMVNQESASLGDLQVYNALPSSENTLVFPYVHKGGTWDSKIIVQNASGSSNNVTVSLYDMNGVPVIPDPPIQPRSLNAYGWWNLYTSIPAGFTGSVVVAGTGPIAAVANLSNTSLTQDATMSYGGVEKKTYETLGLPGEPGVEANPQ